MSFEQGCRIKLWKEDAEVGFGWWGAEVSFGQGCWGFWGEIRQKSSLVVNWPVRYAI